MSESRRANFASFYRATLMPLRRYLARMLRDPSDAEDLAHDAYVRIYKSTDVVSVDQPKAYLFTTARRLALNHIKRRKISPVHASDGAKIIEFAEAGGPGVERVVMARQEWARLEAAIEELPTGCRTVLLLRKRDQLSHEEIGFQLGIAVSTVEKQHARALRLLRAALRDEGMANGRDNSSTGCCAAGR
jgi:RNA polymerase sigma-70 factor (ECF subfamily)